MLGGIEDRDATQKRHSFWRKLYRSLESSMNPLSDVSLIFISRKSSMKLEGLFGTLSDPKGDIMIASKFMIFFRLSILFAYAAAPGQLKCAG